MTDKKNEQSKKVTTEQNKHRNKQLSWMLSGAIVVCFFVFMTGYFIGEQHSLYLFTQKIEQESLSDQIYSSLCVLYDADEDHDMQVAMLPQATDEMVVQESIKAYADDQMLSTQLDAQVTVPSDPCASYYAQVIGFGTYKAAERFVSRLAQRDIKTSIKKRQSRTASGKIRFWYQVVTDVYTDKAELDILVHTLETTEKIKDIRIITC